MHGRGVAFPDEYAHLEKYLLDFFPFLGGAFEWIVMPQNWRLAMSELSRVWHLQKISMGKCAWSK